MNDDKKKYSLGSGTMIMAISAIGVLISFLMALNGKRKKLATVAFLVSFAGLIYGVIRQLSAPVKEEEALLTIELEEDEEAEQDA